MKTRDNVRREGWPDNKTRVHRLYRLEGFTRDRDGRPDAFPERVL